MRYQSMTLEILHMWHNYWIVACNNACRDEDLEEMRRARTRIAQAIADWRA